MSSLDEIKKSEWIHIDGVALYIRKSEIPFDLGPNIQIANVSAGSPGQGKFTKILEEFETWVATNPKYQTIFIENILNPRFDAFFERRGYLLYPNRPDDPPCRFKKFGA